MTAPGPDAVRTTWHPPARWLALAFFGLLAASVVLQVARDRAPLRAGSPDTVLYVRSAAVAQRLALSFDALLADVYWIRAIQHYGGTRRSTAPDKRYHLLEPLLTLAVSLDPLFNIVYRFGAIFLAEPWPGGPGRPDQAIALLKRGLDARPGHWRYMQDIGFVYYWSLRDYRSAAEWFERGSRQPGAPWWMRTLAATTLAQGGDRRASRLLWQSLAETADNEWVQRQAVQRLLQLDALDQLDGLQAIVKGYAASGGARPYSWEAIVRAGYLPAVPVDPAGTPYDLGSWSGDVRLAETSPLQPLPQEPPRMSPP